MKSFLHQVSTNKFDILIVEVPKDAYNFEIQGNELFYDNSVFNSRSGNIGVIQLPENKKYSILARNFERLSSKTADLVKNIDIDKSKKWIIIKVINKKRNN